MRIAVTGVGLVTPLAVGRDESWRCLLRGERSVRWLQHSVAAGSGRSTVDFGAPVHWETGEEPRLTAFARRAAAEAVAQAGLNQTALRQAACVIGTSKIEMQALHAALSQHTHSAAEIESSLIQALLPNTPALAVGRDWGCEAAVLCPVAACATGLVSIIRAAELIRSGNCSIAIAGGTDASLHPGLLTSYRRLGVMARPGDDPAGACRPFDLHRSGFAVGEGAGMLVLENWEHARQRGAHILAEWIDGRLGSDPTGLTAVDLSGKALLQLLQSLLRANQVTPADLGFINVHGTATRQNDEAEAAAFQRLLGNHSSAVPLVGMKGALGHLMGAAGAVETAACVLSLADKVVPPTVNYHTRDSRCPGLINVETLHRLQLTYALKVSLGFGGQMAAGLLKSVP